MVFISGSDDPVEQKAGERLEKIVDALKKVEMNRFVSISPQTDNAGGVSAEWFSYEVSDQAYLHFGSIHTHVGNHILHFRLLSAEPRFQLFVPEGVARKIEGYIIDKQDRVVVESFSVPNRYEGSTTPLAEKAYSFYNALVQEFKEQDVRFAEQDTVKARHALDKLIGEAD